MFGDNENMEINEQYEYKSNGYTEFSYTLSILCAYVCIGQYPTTVYSSFNIQLHNDFKSVSNICNYWLIIKQFLVIITYTTTVNTNHNITK